MDNIYYMEDVKPNVSEKIEIAVIANELLKSDLAEMVHEILKTVDDFNSYEMSYAKAHLGDSLTLIEAALDNYIEEHLTKRGGK